MRTLAALVILYIAASFAISWIDTPINVVSCGQGNHCAACHQNSAPRTHTPEFIRAGHGSVAHLDRTQCLSCHSQTSCNDCHLKTPPDWHTKAFQQPACGRTQRDEHAIIAASHSTSCRECHAHHLQDKCTSCHRPDEEGLLSRFPD